MHAKLHTQEAWNYVDNIPNDKKSKEIYFAINHFIDHKIDEFILLARDVLPYFREKDCNSIGSEELTIHGKKFIELNKYLENNGFPGVNDFHKPIYNHNQKVWDQFLSLFSKENLAILIAGAHIIHLTQRKI